MCDSTDSVCVIRLWWCVTVQTVFVLSGGGGVCRYRQCLCYLVVVVCNGTDSVCVIWRW